MGEIAEMMLDGTLCEGCGEYIDDEGGDGIPRYCSPQCAAGRGMTYQPPESRARARKAERINRERQQAAGRTYKCPKCGRGFRGALAVAQHRRDKHGDTINQEIVRVRRDA